MANLFARLKLSSISRYLRPIVQLACLSAAVALFLNLTNEPVMSIANSVLSADPIMAISTILFYRGAWLPVLLSISVLMIGSFILGRAFCGWICPIGLLIDISGIVSKAFSKVFRRKTSNRRFGYLQFGILTATLLASLVTLNALSILDPFVIFRRSVFMALSGGIPEVLVLILLASIVIAPRFWCRAVCPTGALIGLASVLSPFKFKVDTGCKSCMKCRKACDMGAISKDLKWDATACIKCLECERKCPDHMISFSMTPHHPRSIVYVPPKPQRASKPRAQAADTQVVSQSRRSFLIAGGMLGMFALAKGAKTAVPDEKPLIRPPGSLVEDKFNAACVRCESCAKVCPANVIVLAGIDKGLEKFYTPVLDYNKSKCYLCGLCGDVCPNGTIIRLPDDEMKMGTAKINTSTCYAWNGGDCLKCKPACKHKAITSEGNYKPAVNADICNGCGRCQLVCPVAGKAIIVTNDGENRRTV